MAGSFFLPSLRNTFSQPHMFKDSFEMPELKTNIKFTLEIQALNIN
jgi:hypothetical protein